MSDAKKIPIVTKIKKTCNACPAQWSGKLDNGEFVYIRYRWGYLEVCAGSSIDDAVMGRPILEKEIGGSFDGSMDYETLKEACKELVVFLPETDRVAL